MQRKPAYNAENDLERYFFSYSSMFTVLCSLFYVASGDNTTDGQLAGLQQTIVSNEELLEERAQGAIAIQQGVQQVADIYQDLAHIVNEQQADIGSLLCYFMIDCGTPVMRVCLFLHR